MNSVQLAQRLARNLNVPDVFQLPADAALDVLQAMNGGLSALYRDMPGVYKRTTLSHTVRAPRAVSLTFQAQYSRLVNDDSFVLRDQGCTVRFGNGASDNVVTGPNSVLDNYLGTDLAVSATIYSDAVPIQDVIERIIGHVRLYDNSQSAPTTLTRNERLRGGRAWRRRQGDDWAEEYYPTDCGLSEVGRPIFYYFEPMGVSQKAEPEFLIRLAPLPDIDYTIRLEAELSTQRLVFADLSVARQIAVTDAHIDDILIPLCEAELITSPFWRDKDVAKAVIDRQTKAKEQKKLIPSEIAPTSNHVGTPAGF